MTLNRFFLLFLTMSLIIYFGISPYVIDQKKLQDIPQLEFESFTSYEIEGENVNFIMNKWFGNFKDRIIDHKIVLNARGYGNKYSLHAEYVIQSDYHHRTS